MHNCEEFRERISEHIVDRQDLTSDPRFKPELLVCRECCEFYMESCDMMDALSSVDTHVDAYVGAGFSPAFKYKQKLYILEYERERKARSYRHALQWAAAAAALLVVTAGLMRVPTPPPDLLVPAALVEQPIPLDPATVDFLQQSELLLRNVVKMAPNDKQDLADVKRIANEQLLALDQRKDAAAKLPPVLNVMHTYETVLRDIRNVDEKSATDDVPDIQNRIQRNGLIANIQAFQPRVTTVGFRPH
jgi:hypothetical protein